MPVLVSDTSVLIDLERSRLLEEMFLLPFEFAVPDLLYSRELTRPPRRATDCARDSGSRS